MGGEIYDDGAIPCFEQSLFAQLSQNAADCDPAAADAGGNLIVGAVYFLLPVLGFAQQKAGNPAVGWQEGDLVDLCGEIAHRFCQRFDHRKCLDRVLLQIIQDLVTADRYNLGILYGTR